MVQKSFFCQKVDHLEDTCTCKLSAKSTKPFLRKLPFILNCRCLYVFGLNLIVKPNYLERFVDSKICATRNDCFFGWCHGRNTIFTSCCVQLLGGKTMESSCGGLEWREVLQRPWRSDRPSSSVYSIAAAVAAEASAPKIELPKEGRVKLQSRFDSGIYQTHHTHFFDEQLSSSKGTYHICVLNIVNIEFTLSFRGF